MVLEEVVQKLGLATKKQPNPYKLSWLKKGTEVTVSKCCLVSFSIGSKYKDSVCCDVITMDACYHLLGSPWQFDGDAHQDKKKNTYNFLFGKTKIVLLPSKEVEHKPSKGEGITLLARKEFVGEALKSGIVYVLIGRE